MSLHSRARNLSKKLGIPYQTALLRLRALGARPAEISREYGWPLPRADVFAVDAGGDPEYRAIAASGYAVQEHACAACGAMHFFAKNAAAKVVAGSANHCPVCKPVEDQRQRTLDRVDPPVFRQLRKLKELLDPPAVQEARKWSSLIESTRLKGITDSVRLSKPSLTSIVLQEGNKHLFPKSSISELAGIGQLKGIGEDTRSSSIDVARAGFKLDDFAKRSRLSAATGMVGLHAAQESPWVKLAESTVWQDFSRSMNWRQETVVGRIDAVTNLASADLDRYMKPFRSIHEQLNPLVRATSLTGWSDNISSLAAGWSRLSLDERLSGTGLLAVTPQLGAALAWNPDGRLGTGNKVAAWLSESEAELPQIIAEVEVTCSACGTVLLTKEQALHWKGPREGALSVSIFPACATCIRRGHEDPLYWTKLLGDVPVSREPLRVIDCDGQSDGQPRGQLRLIKCKKDDDNPAAEDD